MSAPDPPPEYTKYRSSPRLFGRGGDDLAPAREPLPGEPPEPGRRRFRRPTPGRVARWVLLALVGWVVLSAVLFLVSAQIEQGKVSDEANALLGGAGFPLTSTNTILVLGSDQRGSSTAEPGARPPHRAGRTRSCCCASAAARTRACRSPATRSSTSRATAARRSTRPTRSAARPSRSGRSSATRASTSTTSSR
jgi:hypothetical protein